MPRDLPQDQPNPRPIHEDTIRQPLAYLVDFAKNKITKLFDHVEDHKVEEGAEKQFVF